MFTLLPQGTLYIPVQWWLMQALQRWLQCGVDGRAGAWVAGLLWEEGQILRSLVTGQLGAPGTERDRSAADVCGSPSSWAAASYGFGWGT